MTAALAVFAGGTHWWWNLPRTPKQLFETRCQRCHPLQDMTRFEVHEYATIVHSMRDIHGAARSITEEEAIIIIHYLENTRGQSSAPGQRKTTP